MEITDNTANYLISKRVPMHTIVTPDETFSRIENPEPNHEWRGEITTYSKNTMKSLTKRLVPCFYYQGVLYLGVRPPQ